VRLLADDFVLAYAELKAALSAPPKGAKAAHSGRRNVG
jgi:hypothetical protein